MTSNEGTEPRLLGSLRSTGDTGVVRMEVRLAAGVAEVWAALTDPDRLDQWLGKFEGDLHQGGEYRALHYASGWEGTGRVDVCEPGRRLRLIQSPGEPDQTVAELALTADGGHTLLEHEEQGLPAEYLAAFGAGIQVHVEDLAAYLAGRGRCDSNARMDELLPAYQELAAKIG